MRCKMFIGYIKIQNVMEIKDIKAIKRIAAKQMYKKQ